MIISLRLPIRCVQDVELQRAFKCLDDTAELPSANTIKNRIIDRYNDIRLQLLAKFPRDGTKISLALDGWSSKNKQSYLAINAYFIEVDWEYHEVLLAFRHMPGHHTGERIAEILKQEIKYHNITDVISAITTDNASNNMSMHKAISSAVQIALQGRGVDTSQLLEHIPCLAHVIQLAISELLGKIHISPTNDELENTWDDDSGENEINSIMRGVPLTLAKVI